MKIVVTDHNATGSADISNKTNGKANFIVFSVKYAGLKNTSEPFQRFTGKLKSI